MSNTWIEINKQTKEIFNDKIYQSEGFLVATIYAWHKHTWNIPRDKQTFEHKKEYTQKKYYIIDLSKHLEELTNG